MRYLALCLLAALIVGCYETTVPLGSPEQTAMDRSFVGDWRSGDETVIIRNLNDHQYYVEYTKEKADADEKTIRMVGDLYPIDSALFAQLRPLPDNGSIEAKHLIIKVSLKDRQLSLRQLNDDFFKSHDVATTAHLRKVLADNLNNTAMYDGNPAVFDRIQPRQSSTTTSAPAP